VHPRIFPRTAALKPKPFEASSHNAFYCTKIFIIFSKESFFKFFPYFLFCSRLPKISWYCTLTHDGWGAKQTGKETTHTCGCQTIFFPGCQQKNDLLAIIQQRVNLKLAFKGYGNN
jgi:hypothetical protein